MTDSADQTGDNEQILALIGVNGWVTDECHPLETAQDVIIGRSRSCDISLRRSPAYLSKSRYDRDNDHDFNTVSRRHVQLSVTDTGSLHIEDLSTNGTYVDDVLMSEALDIDPHASSVQIRLGTRECYQVQLLSSDDYQSCRTKYEQLLQEHAQQARDNAADEGEVIADTAEGPDSPPVAEAVDDDDNDNLGP